MTVRFPLPSVDRWHGFDSLPYSIVCAPAGEQWTVIAHLPDGSTRELEPKRGEILGYGGQHYDSEVELYWDIEDVDAVDFEILRPNSDPVLLSQVDELTSEQEAQEHGWAASSDVAADLAGRNLTRPDRRVRISGSRGRRGDEIDYRDDHYACGFHHSSTATWWAEFQDPVSRREDDLGVSVHADSHTVANAVEAYIRDVVWAMPNSKKR